MQIWLFLSLSVRPLKSDLLEALHHQLDAVGSSTSCERVRTRGVVSQKLRSIYFEVNNNLSLRSWNLLSRC